MPRRCLCDRLRQRIATDPILATLPMGAKWLFMALAERAADQPDGVLHLGSAFGFHAGIAMLIQAAEPEVETHWETLAARGLVLRDGDAVSVPGLDLAPARAATARQNGGLGGRPRKGETAEAARLRRSQGTMLLPVEGSGGKPSETQRETEGFPGTTIGNSISSVSDGSAREVSHAVLGAELATLAGLDPIRQRFDYRPVAEWLKAGMAPDTIRDAVRQAVARDSYDPSKIHSLRWFARPVEAAHAAAAAPAGQDERPPSAQTLAILAWAAAGMDPACRPALAA